MITGYRLLMDEHSKLIRLQNEPLPFSNGIFTRFKNPVLTAKHAPVEWRYDLNEQTNPYGMERFGINAVLNAGAIKFNGKYLLIARVLTML